MSIHRPKHSRADSFAGSIKDILLSSPRLSRQGSRPASPRSFGSSSSSIRSSSSLGHRPLQMPEILVSMSSPRSSLESEDAPVRYVHPHLSSATFRLAHSVSTPQLTTLSTAAACSPDVDPFANEGDSYFVETPRACPGDVEDVSTWDNFLLSVSIG